MKRKLMLIGGLALASSFPMIAASCDSKTIKSEAPEKDVKEPVKTKEIKTETEQPKAKSEIAKAAKENKENKKNLESAGSSNSDSSATPSVPVATEVAKKVENLDDDLEGIRASTYIYDVWARDIYKFEPSKKENEAKDPNKEQEERAEKALRSNLVPRAKQSAYDIDLTNSWLNSLRGK